MKLYHATFQAYFTSIQEKGLVPDDNKTWQDCASGFVYLADDMEAAISFCEAAEDTPAEIFDSGICCFEIDSKFLDKNSLFSDPNILDAEDADPHYFAYAGKIQAHGLKLCWVEPGNSKIICSEYLSEQKPSLDEQIRSASSRAAGSHPASKIQAKENTPER